MAKTRIRRFAALIILLSLVLVHVVSIADERLPLVRAVLFASPTCGHCAKVIGESLPPLGAKYGPLLQIAIVSTATRPGYELFMSACLEHKLHNSVPLLLVGNTALVGSEEIPLKFPGLIEKHLADGGVDWPELPGLRTLLASVPAFASETRPPTGPARPAEEASPPAETREAAATPKADRPIEATNPAEVPLPTAPAASAPPRMPISPEPDRAIPDPAKKVPDPIPVPAYNHKSKMAIQGPAPEQARKAQSSGIIDLTGDNGQAGIVERIRRDVYGNGLAILVLAGMLLTLLFSPALFRKSPAAAKGKKPARYDWGIPLLALAGLGVAAYLSQVELRQVEAICGPVGDCNTVQQSEYARLFGIFPVGVLGLAGFLAILSAWILRRRGPSRISRWAALGILIMTGCGTLFSLYLTFLEPFVIGATCLWCLSSAIIMTALYILALRGGREALEARSR